MNILARLMTPTPPERPQEQGSVADTAVELQGRIDHSDTKANILMAVSGVSLGLLVPRLAGEGPEVWALRAGAAVLVAVLVVLLVVIRPRISPRAPFNRILDDPDGWVPETPRERAAALAPVARRKYVLVRAAVDLLIAAAVLIGGGLLWSGIAA